MSGSSSDSDSERGSFDGDNIIADEDANGGFWGIGKATKKVVSDAKMRPNLQGRKTRDAARGLKNVGISAAAAARDVVATNTAEQAQRYTGTYEGVVAGYYGAMDVSGGSTSGGVSGPAAGGIQEAKDLTDYAESISSITKDNLVDDIADALRKLGLKVEGSSRGELIGSMLKSIPNTNMGL